ncbi:MULTISPECIES: hypothetical protein [unclassified Clostridium]|uniref:hypothetical protein n=1 Tax=unclassified Clostridium TaxID=2614128 RepID=UPI002907067D|nr:hypothetical protein [Clostridium sp.]MDU5105512.1 hypothetical protein [Clostridium sp.]
MKIIFNEITKSALLEVLEKSTNNSIRIKVVAVGCGKPAYDIYADYVSEDDIELIINEVNFVIAKKDEKICDGIEIKYDKDVYNKGFYIRSL